jgi:hypothetical protein
MKLAPILGLIALATATLVGLAASTPPAPASLIWSGQTWQCGPSPYGNALGFHVAGDTLVAAETATGEGGILWLAGEHPAFTLTVQVLAEQPADGGIYVGADSRGRGYQVRLDNWQRDGNLGGIYCDGVPGGIVARTGCFSTPWLPDAWNDLKITVGPIPPAAAAAAEATAPAAGATRIEVLINGTHVTTYDTPSTPGARVGLQLHSNIQHDHHTPGKKITFKDLTLVPRPAPVKKSEPPPRAH